MVDKVSVSDVCAVFFFFLNLFFVDLKETVNYGMASFSETTKTENFCFQTNKEHLGPCRMLSNPGFVHVNCYSKVALAGLSFHTMIWRGARRGQSTLQKKVRKIKKSNSAPYSSDSRLGGITVTVDQLPIRAKGCALGRHFDAQPTKGWTLSLGARSRARAVYKYFVSRAF